MAEPADSPRVIHENLARVWAEHTAAAWPESLGSYEGQFMMVDTVIAGCANYFFESDHGLDPQRVEILLDTQSDLQELLPELPDETREYAHRLQTLCALLLKSSSSP